MNNNLLQEISQFFDAFQDRTADLLRPLPASQQAELAEEIDLLKTSILNRLQEYLDT